MSVSDKNLLLGTHLVLLVEFGRIRTKEDLKIASRSNATSTLSPLKTSIGPDVTTAGERQRELDRAVLSVSAALRAARKAGDGMNLSSLRELGSDWSASCPNCKLSFTDGHQCHFNVPVGKTVGRRAEDAIELDSSDDDSLDAREEHPQFDMESWYRANRSEAEREVNGHPVIDLTGEL